MTVSRVSKTSTAPGAGPGASGAGPDALSERHRADGWGSEGLGGSSDATDPGKIDPASISWASFIDGHPDPIQLSVDGVVRYVNDAAVAFFGADRPEALLGRPVLSFLADETDVAVMAARRAHLEAGRPTEPFEHEIVDLQGRRRRIRTASVPVTVGGRPGAQTVFRDVAREYRLQSRSEVQQSRLRALAESVPGVLFTFSPSPDVRYAFSYVSTQASALLGVAPDPLDSFFARAIAGVPDAEQAALTRSIDAAVAAGQPWTAEFPYRTPGGTARWFRGRALPRSCGNRMVYHGLLLDITEERSAHQRVAQQRQRMEGIAESLPGVTFQFFARPAAEIGAEAQASDGRDPAKSTDPETGPTPTPSAKDHTPTEDHTPTKDHASEETPGPDGIGWTYGLHYVSPKAADLLGLDPDPDGFFDRFVAQLGGDPAPFLASIESAVRTRSPWRFVMPYRHPDGDRLWVEGRSAPADASGMDASGLDGEVIYNGVLLNVTRREQARRDLLASERTHRSLIDGALDSIYVLSAEGRIMSANAAMADMLGVPPEDLAGRPLTAFLDSKRTNVAAAAEAIEAAYRGTEQRLQIWARRAGGRSFPKDVYLQRGTYFGQPVVIGIGRDITRQKQRERDLQEAHAQAEAARRRAEQARRDAEAAQREAEAAQREAETARHDAEVARQEAESAVALKASFLANMSHEIRTPLTSILGFAEVIASELDASDSSAPLHHFAELIGASGRRLRDTLDGILTLSKFDAGEMHMRPRPVSLQAHVEEAAATFSQRAAEAGLDLHVEAGVPSKLWAEVDPKALALITNNLLSNALKYTEPGGAVWIRARHRTASGAGPVVGVEVEDTGIGMSDAFAEQAFEAFRQESEGHARNYEGIGLGLAIVRQAVAASGGTLDWETDAGNGTRMAVWWPKAPVA